MPDWFKRFLPFISLILLCALIPVCEYFLLDKNPVFLTASNLAAIARQTAVITIVAMGMTMVMVAGGIDLSVGSVMGFVGVLIATLMYSFNWAWPAACLAGLATAVVDAAAGVTLLIRDADAGTATPTRVVYSDPESDSRFSTDSAPCTSFIVCQRSSGFFRRQRWTNISNCGGVSGASSAIGRVSSRKIAVSVVTLDSPSKALRPVIISYSTTPNEKISDRVSTLRP